MDIKQIQQQLASIKKSKIELTAWEKDFIKSVKEKIDKWGDKTALSEKQIATISKIFDKASGVKTAYQPVQKSEPTVSPFPSSSPFPSAA